MQLEPVIAFRTVSIKPDLQRHPSITRVKKSTVYLHTRPHLVRPWVLCNWLACVITSLLKLSPRQVSRDQNDDAAGNHCPMSAPLDRCRNGNATSFISLLYRNADGTPTASSLT